MNEAVTVTRKSNAPGHRPSEGSFPMCLPDNFASWFGSRRREEMEEVPNKMVDCLSRTRRLLLWLKCICKYSVHAHVRYAIRAMDP